MHDPNTPTPRPEIEQRITELLTALSTPKRGDSAHVVVVLDAIISDLPASVNKLYLAGRGGQRYKNPKATAFTNTANADILKNYPDGKPDVPGGKQLAFRVICYYPWPGKFKNGKEKPDGLLRNDADNRLKVALDATASVLHFDDKVVYDVAASKRRGVSGLLKLYPGGYCRVTLTVIGDLPPAFEP